MKLPLLAAVVAPLLFATHPPGSKAQESHEAHHPAETLAQATQPQPANTAATPSPDGAMGGGAMMSMMGMMSAMMGRGPMAMSDMAMPGMEMADRIEGRLAFLRTELKLAEPQTRVWNDFADTLRANAKKLGEARTAPQGVDATQPLAQLDRQERWYVARLDGIRAIKAALQPLYAALSPEQQRLADQLMGPHLGLAPMAMMSMGGMSAGATQQGPNPQANPPMGQMPMPGGRR